MNYHFTTTQAHVELAGGTVLELITDEGLKTTSSNQFKGNMDLGKLQAAIEEYGAALAYVRMEATTNLVGGQPFSLDNLREVAEIAHAHNIPLVFDASLISENAFLIKEREAAYKDWSIGDIIREQMKHVDIMYLSGRKSTAVRGGLIATNSREYYDRLLNWLPVYEGFATYGGMSTKEIEAMAVGLREMCETDVAGSATQFIKYFVERLDGNGVPVVTPAGRPGLPCRCQAFPAAHPPAAIPGRRAGRGALPDLRHPQHGARHHLDRP